MPAALPVAAKTGSQPSKPKLTQEQVTHLRLIASPSFRGDAVRYEHETGVDLSVVFGGHDQVNAALKDLAEGISHRFAPAAAMLLGEAVTGMNGDGEAVPTPSREAIAAARVIYESVGLAKQTIDVHKTIDKRVITLPTQNAPGKPMVTIDHRNDASDE